MPCVAEKYTEYTDVFDLSDGEKEELVSQLTGLVESLLDKKYGLYSARKERD